MVRALCADAGAGRKHALRWLAERDRDDALSFGKALAGAQVERDAGPTPVVDEALQRDEGLGVRLRVNAFFGAVADVIARERRGAG